MKGQTMPAAPHRFRYVGPSTRPVEVLGRVVRRVDSPHTTRTTRNGEQVDVPDVLELPAAAVDAAGRLDESPIFERATTTRTTTAKPDTGDTAETTKDEA